MYAGTSTPASSARLGVTARPIRSSVEADAKALAALLCGDSSRRPAARANAKPAGASAKHLHLRARLLAHTICRNQAMADGARRDLIRAHMADGDMQSAVELLEELAGRALAAEQELWVSHKLVVALLKLGRLDEAVARAAVVAKHKDRSVLVELGDALLQRTRYSDAVVQLRTALNSEAHLAPGLAARAWSKLGHALFRLDACVDAEVCLRKAMAAGHKSPQMYNDLALALKQLGRPAEGLPYMALAVGVSPDDKDLRRNLADLHAAVLKAA